MGQQAIQKVGEVEGAVQDLQRALDQHLRKVAAAAARDDLPVGHHGGADSNRVLETARKKTVTTLLHEFDKLQAPVRARLDELKRFMAEKDRRDRERADRAKEWTKTSNDYTARVDHEIEKCSAALRKFSGEGVKAGGLAREIDALLASVSAVAKTAAKAAEMTED